MPPSWTLRCALERRRSAPARCKRRAGVGKFDRRRGSRCAAPAAHAARRRRPRPVSERCSVVMSTCRYLDVGARAGLLDRLVGGVLVGLVDFALLVVADDRVARRAASDASIGARLRPDRADRRPGGDVVLHRAAEIRRRRGCPTVSASSSTSRRKVRSTCASSRYSRARRGHRRRRARACRPGCGRAARPSRPDARRNSRSRRSRRGPAGAVIEIAPLPLREIVGDEDVEAAPRRPASARHRPPRTASLSER